MLFPNIVPCACTTDVELAHNFFLGTSPLLSGQLSLLPPHTLHLSFLQVVPCSWELE